MSEDRVSGNRLGAHRLRQAQEFEELHRPRGNIIDRFFLRLSLAGLIGTAIIIGMLFGGYWVQLNDAMTWVLIYLASAILVSLFR